MKGRHTYTHTYKFVHVYACFFYANLQNYITLWFCFCFCLCRHHCNPFHHRCSLCCVDVCVYVALLAPDHLFFFGAWLFMLLSIAPSPWYRPTQAHTLCMCVYIVCIKKRGRCFLWVYPILECVCTCVCVHAQALSLSFRHILTCSCTYIS